MSGKLMLSNTVKGLLLGLAATLLWASFYPATRFIYGTEETHCDPFQLSFIRFTISTLFFLVPVMTSASRRQTVRILLRQEWQPLLFLSFTGVVVQGVLVFISQKYTTAARGSLMANAAPIFTVIAAWLILKENITRSMLLGMLIGFGGLTLSMMSKNSDMFLQNGGSTLLGDLLALLSGVAWAIYTVAGVRISQKYDSICITMLIFLAGALMMPLVMLIAGSPFTFDNLTPRLWLGMLYMGLVTGGTGFCLWMLALRFVPSSMLGAYGYLSALLAALISMLVLHEAFSLQFIIAVIITLSGMALMMRTKHSR